MDEQEQRAALAEQAHRRWGPAFCISDLGEHSFGECDHQATWLDFASNDIAALHAAGLGLAPLSVIETGEALHAEGERAKALHGEPADRPGTDWLAILAEEAGEVAMAVTKGEVPPVKTERHTYLADLHGELLQVASVAMRWRAAITAALEADHE